MFSTSARAWLQFYKYQLSGSHSNRLDNVLWLYVEVCLIYRVMKEGIVRYQRANSRCKHRHTFAWVFTHRSWKLLIAQQVETRRAQSQKPLRSRCTDLCTLQWFELINVDLLGRRPCAHKRNSKKSSSNLITNRQISFIRISWYIIFVFIKKLISSQVSTYLLCSL